MSKEQVKPEERGKWTLMFYFASDNPLAPSIVNQLKALKAAGFHAGANVVAYFDPFTRNAPSHVFEVNAFEKLKREPGASLVGFEAEDSFVRNLVLDKVWERGDPDGEQVRREVEDLARQLLKKARKGERGAADDDGRRLPVLPDRDFSRERSPEKSLTAFLDFCRVTYPAEHFMLFILGHGVVVGNDIFLSDSNTGDDPDAGGAQPRPAANGNGNGNGSGDSAKPGARADKRGGPRPRNSLTLGQLAEVLGGFNKRLGEGRKLKLLSFHSCSLSGAEVVYELRDAAHYMIASQGPAFVGSWPYKQILLRVFKDLGDGAVPRSLSPEQIKEMVRDIFYYVVYNSYDFQLAGYSFDAALCDLTKAGKLAEAVYGLAQALRAGLGGGDDLAEDARPLVRELILLAHWDAQSFWQENYTDLYDFCFRLQLRCERVLGLLPALKGLSPALGKIAEACAGVRELLEKGVKGDDDRLVVRAEFVGSEYQYSHGLSIFFPWARPADDFFDKTYVEYEFSKQTGWDKFLGDYFERTLRATRAEEDKAEAERRRTEAERRRAEAEKAAAEGLFAGGRPRGAARILGVVEANAIERKALELLQRIGTSVFTTAGQLAKSGPDDRTGPPPAKSGPDDPTGGSDCGCPAFKNHPAFTGVGRRRPRREPEGREEATRQSLSITIAERFPPTSELS